jgi:pilus assembly protein CpaB
MKPARIIVIGVAAVSAIGLALVVRAMGSGGEPTQTASAAVVAAPMARVLVAARDLEPGRRLTSDDLTWKEWPIDGVIATYVTDGSVPLPHLQAQAEAGATAQAEVEGAQGAVQRVARAAETLSGGGAQAAFIGAVVREPLATGEPIVSHKIVRAGDSGYMAAFLEPGMRAMAISVTVESAAGGFILPGDRVDVLLTRETNINGANTSQQGDTTRFTSSTVMQNIRILAIDQSTRANDDAQSVVGATATLAVSPRDAEALALARSEGDLSLVLRSYADAAAPSGRVATARQQTSTVRVHRGQDVETVVVQ